MQLSNNLNSNDTLPDYLQEFHNDWIKLKKEVEKQVSNINIPPALWLTLWKTEKCNWWQDVDHKLEMVWNWYKYEMKWSTKENPQLVREIFTENLNLIINENPNIWNISYNMSLDNNWELKLEITFDTNYNINSNNKVLWVVSNWEVKFWKDCEKNLDESLSNLKSRKKWYQDIENLWYSKSNVSWIPKRQYNNDCAARMDIGVIKWKSKTKEHQEFIKLNNTKLQTVTLNKDFDWVCDELLDPKKLYKYKNKIVRLPQSRQPNIDQRDKSKEWGILAYHWSATWDAWLIDFWMSDANFSYWILSNGIIVEFFDPSKWTAATWARSSYKWNPTKYMHWIACEFALPVKWVDVEDPNQDMLNSAYLLSNYVKKKYKLTSDNITTSAKDVWNDYPLSSDDIWLLPDENLSVKDLWNWSWEVTITPKIYEKNNMGNTATKQLPSEKFIINYMNGYDFPSNINNTNVDFSTHEDTYTWKDKNYILKYLWINQFEFNQRKRNPWMIKENWKLYFKDAKSKQEAIENIYQRIDYSIDLYDKYPSYKKWIIKSIIYWKVQAHKLAEIDVKK